VIDTHCHLLPGLDDGPRSDAEAIELARRLVEAGVEHVLCTPHFSSMFPTSHAAAKEQLSLLAEALRSADVELDLSLAAEVAPGTAVSVPLEELAERSIQGRYVVVEVLQDTLPPTLEAIWERLEEAGLCPIFAHPERSRAVQGHPDLVDPLRAEGALVQVVAPSLVGRWGPEVESAALRLVDTGRTDLLASDAHGAKRRRVHLRAASALVLERLGESVLEELTERKPGLVLQGAPAT
jgi:protein-tyrosine phosphatase